MHGQTARRILARICVGKHVCMYASVDACNDACSIYVTMLCIHASKQDCTDTKKDGTFKHSMAACLKASYEPQAPV